VQARNRPGVVLVHDGHRPAVVDVGVAEPAGHDEDSPEDRSEHARNEDRPGDHSEHARSINPTA
jgi:hypothetical protein